MSNTPPDRDAILQGAEQLLGTRVMDFDLTAVLGSGGMSVVYRARHHITGQEVAVKMLPPELALQDESKARFVEEARVLARLDHPGIVHLNNFTEVGGRLCLIMQFVEGITFEHLIESQGKLPPAEAVRVALEVLAALDYAHTRGVVHRDIKPSNIIVRPDGSIKVTDFGIARIVGATRLTSTGQTMGTVRYMSPEQVRGEQVDLRSDIYSLGVTLYEALAGRVPFEGETQFAIMEQHVRRRPPLLSALGATVQAELERVVLRALEKRPGDRFASAVDFADALRTGAAGSPVARRRLGARSRARSWPVAGGAVAVALALAIAAYFGALRWRGRAPAAGGNRPLEAAKAISRPGRPPARSAAGQKGWPPPYALPGINIAVDRTFEGDVVRIQSARPRDLEPLRARVLEVRALLLAFLNSKPQAALPAHELESLAESLRPLPINLVVVPPEVLARPELWPGFHVGATAEPSRYVEPRRTLFVADRPGFERRDLAYGLALHALYPIAALSNQQCLELAERFEGYYVAHAPP